MKNLINNTLLQQIEGQKFHNKRVHCWKKEKEMPKKIIHQYVFFKASKKCPRHISFSHVEKKKEFRYIPSFTRPSLRYKNPKLKGYDLNLLTIKLGGRFKVPTLNKYQ